MMQVSDKIQELRAKIRSGQIKPDKTFQNADEFARWYDAEEKQ